MTQPAIVAALEPLFHPRSVAVIGATNNFAKWGYSTFASIMNSYPGDLYPVNRHDREILGYPAFPRVTDIPGPVDLVVIVVPPENVSGIMRDCVDKGVKAGVIITAGFAEVGAEGKAMQDEVMRIARSGGIRLVGPNCMGMWSAAANLPAFMFPMSIMEGPLALISQGGNIGGALVADAFARGVGFQQYVSCGCTADIQIEDYIEYLGYDDSVEVILAYIEGLAESNRFVEKVRAVTSKKPVVVMKPGKTGAAARAISSHSGAMSGSDRIYDAAFRKAGVIRAENTTQLLDVSIGFLTQPLPKGRNVVITTPGGSYGVICAEACALRDLNVIDLPASAMETFSSMFPSRWSHGNPVDPAGDRNFVQYLRAPEILLQLPEVHAVIFMGFGSFSGLSSTFASGLAGPRMQMIGERMKGVEELARNAVGVIESRDPAAIGQIVRAALKTVFGSIMVSDASDLEAFVDLLSESLTTERMLQSAFYEDLKALFTFISEGTPENIDIEDVFQLIESIIGALLTGWIQKYGKPVITTTFTEVLVRLSEEGHFPYSSVERAATVLAKLTEYGEYLERIEARGDKQPGGAGATQGDRFGGHLR